MNRVLMLQLAILGLCAWALVKLASNFPYPSPIIRPLLPPKLRWPTEQVQAWVNAENFPPGFLEYFSRDPHRTIPPGASFVAPADGVIKNEFQRNGVSYLVIGMSFWDVHVIRAPTEGVVIDLAEEGIRVVRDHQDQARQAADIYERGKDAPVQKIVTFRTKYGDVKVHMISSYWASRIKVWVYGGQSVKKGERIGRILLGSTTVLEMPGNVTFLVRPGERVWGGQSIVYKPQDQ